ncbi:hypothetical protein [Streptomyces sp. NPDC007988]|uniref:hypothetical protein n=1 Tax=Streptomyces sp. NPDC007988 TaxID=3364802 RepID=UPI0036F04084
MSDCRSRGLTPPALLGVAPSAIGMSYAALLRAAGDTRTVMIASVTSDHVLLIPLGRYLGGTPDSASASSTASPRPGRSSARCTPSSSCRATEGVSGYRHGPARSPRESRSTRPRHRARGTSP